MILLWRLFILGNSLAGLNEERRRFVHDRLTALQKAGGLGSARRARIVEETRKRIFYEVGHQDVAEVFGKVLDYLGGA
jgi:hypothetical protein